MEKHCYIISYDLCQPGRDYINLHSSVNWQALGMLLIVFLLTNILYMGFVKFYRRFTLENYMALLTEKKKDGNK